MHRQPLGNDEFLHAGTSSPKTIPNKDMDLQMEHRRPKQRKDSASSQRHSSAIRGQSAARVFSASCGAGAGRWRQDLAHDPPPPPISSSRKRRRQTSPLMTPQASVNMADEGSTAGSRGTPAADSAVLHPPRASSGPPAPTLAIGSDGPVSSTLSRSHTASNDRHRRRDPIRSTGVSPSATQTGTVVLRAPLSSSRERQASRPGIPRPQNGSMAPGDKKRRYDEAASSNNSSSAGEQLSRSGSSDRENSLRYQPPQSARDQPSLTTTATKPENGRSTPVQRSHTTLDDPSLFQPITPAAGWSCLPSCLRDLPEPSFHKVGPQLPRSAAISRTHDQARVNGRGFDPRKQPTPRQMKADQHVPGVSMQHFLDTELVGTDLVKFTMRIAHQFINMDSQGHPSIPNQSVLSRRFLRPRRARRRRCYYDYDSDDSSCSDGESSSSMSCNSAASTSSMTTASSSTGSAYQDGQRECQSCATQKTPLWRDAEDGTPLCNACGIRYKKYHVRCSKCWYIPRKEEKSSASCRNCRGRFVSTRRSLH